MLTDQDKADVLKMKYGDHTEDLRFRQNLDLKVLTGFITLNLALAAWLSQYPPQSGWIKAGFTVLAAAIGVVTGVLLDRNMARRKMVVTILHNVNDALELTTDGAYGIKGAINPPGNKADTKFRLRWHYGLIALFVVVQSAIVWGQPSPKANSGEVPKGDVVLSQGRR